MRSKLRYFRLPPQRAHLPRVKVQDRRLVCNGAALDLALRPTMYRLFAALCASADGTIDRDEILAKVYRIEGLEQRSARYIHAVNSNVAKLVSRARILATMHLGHAVGPGVEWLAYDHGHKRWSLYRLREEYFRNLRARQGE